MLPQWELGGGSCEQAFREFQKASVRLQSLKPGNLVSPVFLRVSERGKEEGPSPLPVGLGFMGSSALGGHLYAKDAAPLPIPQAQTFKLGHLAAPWQGF